MISENATQVWIVGHRYSLGAIHRADVEKVTKKQVRLGRNGSYSRVVARDSALVCGSEDDAKAKAIELIETRVAWHLAAVLKLEERLLALKA